MVKGELGDLFIWKGKLARIVGICNEKVVIVEYLEHSRCPRCNHDLGAESFPVIESSPLFQENAKPIKTIKS